MTLQAEVEEGNPIVEERVNERFEGVIKRILNYEFLDKYYKGRSSNRSEAITTLLILDKKQRLEKELNFNGFVGRELIGKDVSYEDITRTIITFLFQARRRENEPKYIRDKIQVERVYKIVPKNKNLPSYLTREIHVHS